MLVCFLPRLNSLLIQQYRKEGCPVCREISRSECLSRFVVTIFKNIPEDNLLSFKWDFGCWAIADALNDCNAFRQRPFRLEHISISAHKPCLDIVRTEPVPLVAPFRNLKSLVWSDLKTCGDLVAVRDSIKDSTNLKTLELATNDSVASLSQTDEVRSWAGSTTGWRMRPAYLPYCLSICNIGGEKSIGRPVNLAQLTRLSLSSFDLRTTLHAEILRALNIFNLKCLRLDECEFYLRFLETITSSKKSLKLKQLMINHSVVEDYEKIFSDEFEEWMSTTLARFIDSCPDLEDLFLKVPARFNWNVLSAFVLMHAETLRRLVLHPVSKFQDAVMPTDENIEPELSPIGNWSDLVSLECIGTTHLGYP